MPALESPAVHIPLYANADLRTLQYTGLKLVSGTDFAVDSATVNTDKPAGVLQNKPNQYQAADAIQLGVSKAKAGGTIHVGDKLTVTTGGVFIALTTDKKNYWGFSLTEAATNDIFTMFVCPGMESV